MITTQQELDNVQRYVALENIRFNEGITLTLQCETYDLDVQNSEIFYSTPCRKCDQTWDEPIQRGFIDRD